MIKLSITLQSGAFVYDKKLLKAALRKAGQEVANDARALIRAKIGGGRLYRGSGGSSRYRGYKAGHYQASAAGNPPTSVTGTLARSMKVLPFKSGEGVAIRDTMFYGLFLEAGAVGGVASGNRSGSKLSTRRANPNATLQRGGKRNVYKRKLLAAVVGQRVLQPRPFLSTALEQNPITLAHIRLR